MGLKKLWYGISLATLIGIGSLTSASANDDLVFNTKSLIGFEGGYANFNVDNNYNLVNPTSYIDPTETYNAGHIGLKVGAQGDDFRVFFSVRNYFIGSEYDYFYTYGASGQYLFNFSKQANFFIGVNGGYLNSKFQAKNERFNRTLDGVYYGGDIGINYHITDKYDLEVGARVMFTDADTSATDSVKYSLDYIASGYASFIIKFVMD